MMTKLTTSLSKRSEASLWCVGHLRNLSEHSGITHGDDYPYTTTRYAVSALHANASCLKVIVVGAIDGTAGVEATRLD